jgi:hypothetical protein
MYLTVLWIMNIMNAKARSARISARSGSIPFP